MTQTPATSLEKLKQALDAGAIDQATFDAAAAGINARLAGSGAIAQGPGAAAGGAGSIVIQGDNNASIVGVLIQQAARPGASRQELRRAWLARILRQADQLPLFAGDNANAQVRLSSVYTALLTQRSEDDPAAGRAARHPAASPERAAKNLSALDVLNAERKLVLLGGPGSGKSTFVNFVALSMAGEALGMPGPNLATLTAPVPREAGNANSNASDKPESQHWDHGALLPVQVVLRDLASQLPPPGHAVDADADTVWTFIRGRLKQAALDDFAPHLREELLEHGGLVLLDGLDEVPDAFDRREQIKRAVQDFAATFSRCRFLVTSRTYAYQRQDWKLDGFSEVQLLPFTTGQIHGFVDAWYAHMVGLERLTEAAASDRADVLKREAARSERLRELAERPLLLTLIAQLQTEGGGRLPEKREELYDKAVEMLLTRWESLKVRVRPDGTREIEPSLAEWLNAGRDDIRKQLNRLAFEAHRDQPQLTGTADIAQRTLTDALLDASANRADVKVKRLEEYLCHRAGILAAHGERMYQFPHRSFQEYLAACHLTDDEFPDKLAALARADANRWREVALLAGAKAARGSSLSAWALSETLCLAPPPQEAATEADHWGALLAGRVLVECADLARVAARDVPKRERVREWQRTIMRRNTLPAVERALAGRTLAVLGDPRPEVMTLDGMHFCLVPPGPFTMGDDAEKPEHTVDLRYPYFIGRFPVTVAQWREHVQDGGRTPGDERRLSRRDNDPVLYGSWHDAVAFCKALTQRWQSLLPPGFEVALPSEAEWEKAARGGERIAADLEWLTIHQTGQRLETAADAAQMRNPFPKRSYPWGETFDADKANAGSAIGETSAVGCYPVGFSPCGCEDMIGNVWEWTRSLWGEKFFEPEFGYPYRSNDAKREDLKAKDKVLRVVRGGSWGTPRDNARCACRIGDSPGNHDDIVGFRVVLRSAPVF
jgi:formylglycine-generating enzyme required for sulfatase activity